MANVCVILGGDRNVGLETAKYMPKEKIIVLSGRTVEVLQAAVETLRARGYTVFAKYCDVSKRNSVKELVQFACGLGNVRNVIHAEDFTRRALPAVIAQGIALGTVYVNQEFSKVMKAGGVIVDVSSCEAYSLSAWDIPQKIYPLADTDEGLFLQSLLKKTEKIKEEEKRTEMAYALSKHFVVWYAKKCAFEYGEKGLRVVSVSLGLIAEDEAEISEEVVLTTAEKRAGKASEAGYLLATTADERNGYLAGVDVLCDGGSVTRRKEFQKK